MVAFFGCYPASTDSKFKTCMHFFRRLVGFQHSKYDIKKRRTNYYLQGYTGYFLSTVQHGSQPQQVAQRLRRICTSCALLNIEEAPAIFGYS